MSKKYFLTAVGSAALLLLGAGCFSKSDVETNSNVTVNTNTSVTTNSSTTTGSFETSEPTTNTSDNTPAQTTLTITSSGMSPKSLTVSKGTSVTIANDDTVTHEIAADPHPSHSSLPSFDRSVAPGGTFTFTFTQTGTFGYHDHLDSFNSKWKGTVIVQ